MVELERYIDITQTKGHPSHRRRVALCQTIPRSRLKVGEGGLYYRYLRGGRFLEYEVI